MAYTKKFVDYYDVFKSNKAYEKVVSMLNKLFRKHNVKTVLDIGCGTGKIADLLTKRGYVVVGIDNSKEMIKQAKYLFPKITFKLMDAQSFKFNKKFDAVIALDSVLTYLTNNGEFEKAIKNITKHMKNEAVFYFLTGFTERQIPTGFTDNFYKRVSFQGKTYKKEFLMKRKGKLLITDLKIFEDSELIVEEQHVHRIISEKAVVKLLEHLGCEVQVKGNSEGKEHSPLQIIAVKT